MADRATDLAYDPEGWGAHNRSRRRWSVFTLILCAVFIVKNVIVAGFAIANSSGLLLTVSILLTVLWGWLAHSAWRSYRAH